MKYSININQKAAAKIAPDLDFNDLAIYDFIKSFATSGNCTTIQDGGRTYYWIAHATIIAELPLLHIKSKSGIVARIGKLIDAGILEKYEKCENLGRTFYTFGAMAASLETDTPTPTPKKAPLQNFVAPPTKICTHPLQNFVGDYNINDNITKDYVGEKEFSPHTPDDINIENDGLGVNAETDTPKSSAAPPLNKKTLFRNSAAADREKFFKTFTGDDYANIDMEYYYRVVADWSDSSNTMRTERGWFATVRTFIRGDKEKNKLHKKQSNSIFDWDAAKAYLRM